MSSPSIIAKSQEPRAKSQEPRAKSQEPILWLSTLRGLAIILVFISHTPLFEAPFGFIYGRIGVVLFFLMAGYLTVTARERRNTRQYLFSRFVRLYPVYWILLVMLLIMGSKITLVEFLLNMTMLQHFLRSKIHIMNGGVWMMPMMLAFFTLIAITGVKFFSKSKNTPLIVILIIMILALITSYLRFKTGRRFPTAFFLLTAVAFIGMYYYEMTHDGTITSFNFICTLVLFELLFVISVYLSYCKPLAGASNPVAYIISYNAGFLIFFIASKLKFSFSPLNKIGDISYVMFLSHGHFLSFMGKFFPLKGLNYSSCINFLITFTVVVIFSYLVTHFIEKPIVKFGKQFEKKLA